MFRYALSILALSTLAIASTTDVIPDEWVGTYEGKSGNITYEVRIEKNNAVEVTTSSGQVPRFAKGVVYHEEKDKLFGFSEEGKQWTGKRYVFPFFSAVFSDTRLRTIDFTYYLPYRTNVSARFLTVRLLLTKIDREPRWIFK